MPGILRRVSLCLVCLGLITGVAAAQETPAPTTLREKLKNIIIPKISFEDTPVSTVFMFLKDRSRELDPDGIGINFVLMPGIALRARFGPDDFEDEDEEFEAGDEENEEEWEDEEEDEEDVEHYGVEEPTITMDFDNIPLGELIRYICAGAGLQYEVQKYAVLIWRDPFGPKNMQVRFYPINPRSFKKDLGKIDFKKYLEGFGVTFSAAARVHYNWYSGKLVIRNTPENLRLTERILQTSPSTAKLEPKPESPGIKAMREKLEKIIILRIVFKHTPVSTVFQFLTDRMRELDPDGAGVSFRALLRTVPTPEEPVDDDNGEVEEKLGEDDDVEDDYQEPTVTVDLDHIPSGEAIRYICLVTGLRCELKAHAVVILGPGLTGEPDFTLRLFAADSAIFEEDGSGDGIDFQKWFENWGVDFPATVKGNKASISYDYATRKLIVRNTPENLRSIEEMLLQLSEKAPGVVAGAAAEGENGGGVCRTSCPLVNVAVVGLVLLIGIALGAAITRRASRKQD